MHFVKLPNFLSIESRPFDPETYEDELDDDSLQQQVGSGLGSVLFGHLQITFIQPFHSIIILFLI